jgi:hypothetical protein
MLARRKTVPVAPSLSAITNSGLLRFQDRHLNTTDSGTPAPGRRGKIFTGMAYIPGCGADVFISYVHLDNVDGWITRLKSKLTQS